jgi:hypothetical protein
MKSRVHCVPSPVSAIGVACPETAGSCAKNSGFQGTNATADVALACYVIDHELENKTDRMLPDGKVLNAYNIPKLPASCIF